MDPIVWIAITVLVVFLIIGIIAIWMQPPDDNTCECQPARFCCRCGKKLSTRQQDNSM
jgi:uncharacterized membrane protein YqiK